VTEAAKGDSQSAVNESLAANGFAARRPAAIVAQMLGPVERFPDERRGDNVQYRIP
jgi:hypothetical protein